jgi:hypothetical protein
MIAANSKIFVSSNGLSDEFALPEVRDKLLKSGKTTFILSCFAVGVYDYSVLKAVGIPRQTSSLMHMRFVNYMDIAYDVFCTPDQKFFTVNRMFKEARDVNLLDVLVDVQDRFCRLVKKELMEYTSPVEVCQISMFGDAGTYFCDGMLVSSY